MRSRLRIPKVLQQTLTFPAAAIAAVAREHKRTVLTDDLDLYLMLQRDKVEGVNFTHLRARIWET